MITLRLIADDLTGALDTSAELVGLTGPVSVFWHDASPSVLPANAALDSGTRELDVASATRLVPLVAFRFSLVWLRPVSALEPQAHCHPLYRRRCHLQEYSPWSRRPWSRAPQDHFS